MTGIIDRYIAHLHRQGASPQTIKNYGGVLRQLEAWAGVPIEDVTPDQAAMFVRRPHLSQGTKNTYHRWLSAFAAWAGLPLLEDVRRPRPPRPAPRAVDPSQVSMILAACEDDQERGLVLLGACSLRRAEIARFRGEQLDVFEGTLRVRGKGDRDDMIPAPPALVSHARRMPRGYWFPSPKRPGRPVTAHTVWARTTTISSRAGAGHVTPHRLRHTYATQMVRNGTPLTTVQRCMRHSQLSTTAIYIRVAEDDLQAAAASLPWSGWQVGPEDPPALAVAS